MGFVLREDLSFCFVGRHAVFLDIGADRYFGVSEASSAALARASEGADAGADPAIAALLSSGVLLETPGGEVPAPQTALPLDRDFDDGFSGAAIRPAAFAGAVAALGSTAIELRARGFPAVVRRLRSRRQIVSHGDARADVAAILTGFRATQAVFSANRRCLLYSLALGRRLQRSGAPFQLVIAVKLAPFAAHCWIQQGDCLLNDSLDHARLFTPILTL